MAKFTRSTYDWLEANNRSSLFPVQYITTWYLKRAQFKRESFTQNTSKTSIWTSPVHVQLWKTIIKTNLDHDRKHFIDCLKKKKKYQAWTFSLQIWSCSCYNNNTICLDPHTGLDLLLFILINSFQANIKDLKKNPCAVLCLELVCRFFSICFWISFGSWHNTWRLIHNFFFYSQSLIHGNFPHRDNYRTPRLCKSLELLQGQNNYRCVPKM